MCFLTHPWSAALVGCCVHQTLATHWGTTWGCPSTEGRSSGVWQLLQGFCLPQGPLGSSRPQDCTFCSPHGSIPFSAAHMQSSRVSLGTRPLVLSCLHPSAAPGSPCSPPRSPPPPQGLFRASTSHGVSAPGDTDVLAQRRVDWVRSPENLGPVGNSRTWPHLGAHGGSCLRPAVLERSQQDRRGPNHSMPSTERSGHRVGCRGTLERESREV